MESGSPPRPICCFWYSSPKNHRKKSKGTACLSKFDIEDNGNWGRNGEILSDMSTFSVEEQERRLKKAMAEEKRVCREAERVVEWVKQESARLDVSAIKNIVRQEDETIK
ncbi:unnamed protein product [Ilex paraguariensis]|uniref:Uncharacterized protein n=1 Tax=Ilex paraguariensis TaxID=185542 RepID=A0ABC8T1R1_9AQUA